MRFLILITVTIGTVAFSYADGINVATNASANATYGTYSESAGPFPWSDFGITAGANVSAGQLNVGTGGSTNYTLNSAITGSETFTSGSTVLQLGYSPGWTGSFAGTAPTGDLNSQLVYNIGPISGSATLVNAPLAAPGASGDLAASLDSGLGIPVISNQAASGLGISTGVTLKANVGLCPFCVTVASVSLGLSVGTQIQQTVIAQPIVNYDDLIWYSTSPTYSATDTFTTVSGVGGVLSNTFQAPSLALTNGETVYMNILPEVQLTMPVQNIAAVSVPASISADWDVFGVSGSASDSGDLFTLSNGDESFDFDATFYGDSFYSIPLVFTGDCPPTGAACFGSFETPPGGGSLTETGDIPTDLPPGVVITGGSSTPGGYGETNDGPIIPGDPSQSDVCGPIGTPYAQDCINNVTLSPSAEPASFVLLALGFLGLGGARRRAAAIR
jgi:hypothetical protein